jgi:putative endonuclease
MGRERNEIGALGEKLARRFLEANGYRVKCTNFRTPFGELDIVAKHKGSIIFIEVRTRTTSSLGPPSLSVTRVKQLHIIKNALFYLKRYGLHNPSWRIDVVSVKLDNRLTLENIEHIENAVEDIYT